MEGPFEYSSARGYSLGYGIRPQVCGCLNPNDVLMSWYTRDHENAEVRITTVNVELMLVTSFVGRPACDDCRSPPLIMNVQKARREKKKKETMFKTSGFYLHQGRSGRGEAECLGRSHRQSAWQVAPTVTAAELGMMVCHTYSLLLVYSAWCSATTSPT